MKNSKLLGKDEYCVFVDYYPMPSIIDLGVEFAGEYSVSVIFDGRPFQKHASCVDIDETPGDRIFWVASPPSCALRSSEEIIEWGGQQRSEITPNGYRPATEKEALAFARANPKLQCRLSIVALGSFATDGIFSCVAILAGQNLLHTLGSRSISRFFGIRAVNRFFSLRIMTRVDNIRRDILCFLGSRTSMRFLGSRAFGKSWLFHDCRFLFVRRDS